MKMTDNPSNEIDGSFIRAFISIEQPFLTNPFRYSTLVQLLKGAREFSGRDVLTGEYLMKELNVETYSEGLVT